MRLGEHVVGLRKRTDSGGVDEFGDPLLATVDSEIPGSLIVPTQLRSDTVEPEDRAAPAVTGMTWYAPPGTDVSRDDVAVWPITGRTGSAGTGDLQLTGREWQILGDPQPWDESVEVRLTTAS